MNPGRSRSPRRFGPFQCRTRRGPTRANMNLSLHGKYPAHHPKSDIGYPVPVVAEIFPFSWSPPRRYKCLANIRLFPKKITLFLRNSSNMERNSSRKRILSCGQINEVLHGSLRPWLHAIADASNRPPCPSWKGFTVIREVFAGSTFFTTSSLASSLLKRL